MAYRPGLQVSYTISSGTTIQENQPAAQIAAIDSQYRFSDGAIYVMNLYGAGRNWSQGPLAWEAEIASYYTTDALRFNHAPGPLTFLFLFYILFFYISYSSLNFIYLFIYYTLSTSSYANNI